MDSSDRDFDVVGLDEPSQWVYRYALANSPVTAAGVTAHLPFEGVDVREVLARLRTLGLVNQASGSEQYTGVDPRTGLRALTDRTATRLDRVRSAIADLAEVYERAAHSHVAMSPIRVINDPGLIGNWYVRLEQEVEREFLTFDRPPYVLAPDNPIEPQVLARGVEWRTVYDASVLEIPGAWADMRYAASCGERARIGHGLPTKLAIADRRVALVTTELDPDRASAIVVEAPPLVDLLVATFEAVWAQSVDLPAVDRLERSREDAPSEQELVLLSLFAVGAKDEVIARELGISDRTVRRRSADLLARLGARNRFQAGVQAAKRGWI